jgi:hypothetical protein
MLRAFTLLMLLVSALFSDPLSRLFDGQNVMCVDDVPTLSVVEPQVGVFLRRDTEP